MCRARRIEAPALREASVSEELEPPFAPSPWKRAAKWCVPISLWYAWTVGSALAVKAEPTRLAAFASLLAAALVAAAYAKRVPRGRGAGWRGFSLAALLATALAGGALLLVVAGMPHGD
jgi:hypothetical protein